MGSETIKNLTSYFLASRVVFLLFAYLASFLVPLREGYIGREVAPEAPYLAWIWANFDGRHYIDIAVKGYQNTNFAFFPLYPVLISQISKLFSLHPLYTGLIISSVSFFASMLVIRKIILLDFGKKIANVAAIILCFFPLSFFYSSVYTDSLFLFVSSLSFYFARQKRWLEAGVFGFLALYDRLSGIALIPALAVEYYLQNGKQMRYNAIISSFLKHASPGLVIALLGLVSYMVFLQLFEGDFLKFQRAMSAWQQQNLVFPAQVVYRYLKIFLTVYPKELGFWIALLEFFCFFWYLFLTFYVWIRARASYGVFMLILVLLVSFTGTFAGTPRYGLHLFPVFLGMAIIVNNFSYWAKIYMAIIFLILGFILAGLFTRGYFIA